MVNPINLGDQYITGETDGEKIYLIKDGIFVSLNNFQNSKNQINKFKLQFSVYVNECLNENLETLEHSSDKDTVLKILKPAHKLLYEKMRQIIKPYNIIGTKKINKTDIIKYKVLKEAHNKSA